MPVSLLRLSPSFTPDTVSCRWHLSPRGRTRAPRGNGATEVDGTLLLLLRVVHSLGNRERPTNPLAADDEKPHPTPRHSSSSHGGLQWDNVCYSVPVGRRRRKWILADVSGTAIPGCVLAVMGPSGSGAPW